MFGPKLRKLPIGIKLPTVVIGFYSTLHFSYPRRYICCLLLSCIAFLACCYFWDFIYPFSFWCVCVFRALEDVETFLWIGMRKPLRTTIITSRYVNPTYSFSLNFVIMCLFQITRLYLLIGNEFDICWIVLSDKLSSCFTWYKLWQQKGHHKEGIVTRPLLFCFLISFVLRREDQSSVE